MKMLSIVGIRGGGRIRPLVSAAAALGVALGVFAPPSARAALKYEPSNYAARENLLLQLDGIRNVGLLEAHDNDAAQWIDLAAGNTVSFGNKTGDGVVSRWAEDGYVFGGGEIGRLANTIDPGNAFTIQLVFDADKSAQTATYPFFFDCGSDNCGFYTYKVDTNNQLIFRVRAVSGVSDVSIKPWTGRHYYATALYDKGKSSVFETETGTVTAGATTTSVGARAFTIGGRWLGTASDTDRYLDGTIKAVRIYNKVLSAAELSQNRALDEARFFKGIPVTNVVIATSVEGLDGNEPAGVYAYDENGYTFSAPAKAIKDNTYYVCTGYTLETWNGESWSSPVRFAGTSYEATDATAKVRLVWQWQYSSGVPSPDLDPVGSYVSDSLILHLDGIRNVGANVAHDNNAAQWIDLAAGNTVSFGNKTGSGVVSKWADDGYVFGGGEIGRLANTIDPGNAFTIQLVFDADKSKQTADYPFFFDCGGDNCGFYTYKVDTNNQLIFRVRAVSGVSDVSINPWTGRHYYATALYDKGKSSVFETETGTVTAGTTTTSVGARSFTIGGRWANNASDMLRYLNGTIKAVRIYNKVLSAAELSQNRALDEARFFGAAIPVTNVVVASSVRGVSGDTPEGAYALSTGGHTFYAPASVNVGEDVYSCSGYTLETWDAANGAWSTPVLHNETSVQLTDTTAKVRLTWQWTHTAGPGYDLAFNDYATDGLVVHLDGIRNAGAEPVHDSSVATWADLASDGGYASFTNAGEKCGWTADGYRFDSRWSPSYAVMNASRTLGNAFTVQAVVDFDRDAAQSDTSWPHIVGATASSGDPLDMYFNQSAATPGVNFKVANTHVRSGGVTPWGGEYMTGWSDGVNGALFQTATPDATVTFNKTVGEQTIVIGGGNGGSGGYAMRRLNGVYKSSRIYNRALTNAELEKNRAADEVRFFGRPGAEGDLVVASTVDGLGGNLPCGAYRPAGYTFTAPTEATLDGVSYTLAGYTLETWNGTGWANAETGTGASVAPDVSTDSKRLTWNWVVESRLTKVPDYDVGDYVQDGLYLHFDGIRNAGSTAEHSDNATSWTNLGTGGSSFDAVLEYASNASAGDGWETDGYHFKYGGAFACLGANPQFSSQVTVQLVTEAEASGKEGTTYPTYFGSTDDYLNIYGFGAVARAFIKIFNGNNSEVSPSSGWQGKYLTAIWNAGARQIFQIAVPEPDNWGAFSRKTDTFSGKPFYIGGVYKEGDSNYVDERRLTGKIQAVRVYNRALSDEELEHNRMVDEARFKGNAPGANVTIATKYGDGTGEMLAEEVGNYKVEGIYTFSATRVKDSNGVVKNVGGYYLETYVNGAWTGKTWNEGQSFTYTEGAKVRVTWSPNPIGLMIIVK